MDKRYLATNTILELSWMAVRFIATDFSGDVSIMQCDIRDYARLGFAHFKLYPQCSAHEHIADETLPDFIKRDDLEVIDYCLPYDKTYRQHLIPLLKSCDKHLQYALIPFPQDKISLGSLDEMEQGLTRLVIADQINVAAASGARSFTIGSGIDLGEADRQRAQEVFAEFCRWFCRELKSHGMDGYLEPFDRDFARRFLFGPTVECVELIESLQPDIDNLKIQLDMAHIALMRETPEHAIKTAGQHLAHVHLGNCVMNDLSDPFFGDLHPPIGYPGGEIGVPELSECLALLLEVGYLNRQSRGSLVLEMQPWPNRTVEQSIQDGMEKLQQAWQRV